MPSASDYLAQVTTLTQNPSGLAPQMTESEIRAAEAIAAIQNAGDQAAQQINMAHSARSLGDPRQLPDEKQLEFLFGVQPKLSEAKDLAGWTSATFLESAILRHVQFGSFSEAEKCLILDELADLNCMADQGGTEHVRIQSYQELFVSVLLGKSTIHENRPTSMELILSPVQKSEIKSTLNDGNARKSTGFFSFLKGK